MLKGKDKKIVIDYLYNQNMEGLETDFYVKNKIMAENRAVFQYECMTIDQRIDIQKQEVKILIKKYLIESATDSLIGECVHGTTCERNASIKEWAKRRLSSMSGEEIENLFKKLGYTYY